jgi:NAD(P)-dependent dehydrogenase (short-subunit alcohol dehydrogenase family)
MQISFENQVAIVTGAGNGIGRSHALELARRGAKVVVNDLGGARDGSGSSSSAAESVVELIKENGGEAFANNANVTKFEEVEDMVQQTMTRWGRVDVLINNAGILRDKSFAKMDLDDFDIVMDVHLKGAVNCTKAVWHSMLEQNYGRILFTSSSSGIYGNFGQSNYGTAKMALIGLMNTLVIESSKCDIKINAIVPTANSRMTQDVMPEEVLNQLSFESVTAGALALCQKDAPNRTILNACAGGFSRVQLFETDGIHLPSEEQTVENVVKNWDKICDQNNQQAFTSGIDQIQKFLKKAASHSK